ncbi:MAG TPA: hypothetical protein VGR64_03095, partial [Terracidiphilus sp.]|nr:hypothetical protein [Terracidiphilus sp.]
PNKPTTIPAVNACPLATLNAAAADAVQNVQLSTGVQSAQTDVPIDSVTTFNMGQTIYVTFEMATNASGTLAGTICTNGALAATSIAVPSGQSHRRGEFHLPSPLAARQTGSGSVTLSWNGAVCAALSFVVTA